jgi:hypothetical protein
MKKSRSQDDSRRLARLNKRGYVVNNGRMLTIVPITTLREHPCIRKDIGITDEQWEAINQ